MIPLTAEQVMRCTGSTLANAKKYLPFIQGTCKAYDITSRKRLSGFLSQIGHECDGLSVMQESLNYTVEALVERFGRHRISIEDAQKYGRAPGRPANQPMIANLIYGGEWGRKNLGNLEWGHGWKHRGMGGKQLTGLSNQKRCGEAIGEDFVNFPERLLMPVNAMLSAGWFWNDKKLNQVADAGDVERMTELVNGGHNGLEERTALWHAGLEVFA